VPVSWRTTIPVTDDRPTRDDLGGAGKEEQGERGEEADSTETPR
jgi:hypothetical protein